MECPICGKRMHVANDDNLNNYDVIFECPNSCGLYDAYQDEFHPADVYQEYAGGDVGEPSLHVEDQVKLLRSKKDNVLVQVARAWEVGGIASSHFPVEMWEKDKVLQYFNVRVNNLTQHVGTKDQHVIEPRENEKMKIAGWLNFFDKPSKAELERRAENIAELCQENYWHIVMIGGAPFFMAYLERALEEKGVKYLYAFSLRESVEKEVNGKVVKTNVFKHSGWI
jgi:hypothetical protein